MKEVATFYAAPVLLFVAWMVLRKKKLRLTLFAACWISLLIGTGIIGAVIWKEYYDYTRIASILFLSSSIILTGPALTYTLSKKWDTIWTGLIAIVLPIATRFIITIGLLFAGHISI